MVRKVEGGGRSGCARPRDGEEGGGWWPERSAPEGRQPERAATGAGGDRSGRRWERPYRTAAGVGGAGSGQIGRRWECVAMVRIGEGGG
jgi:hypothetical protein